MSRSPVREDAIRDVDRGWLCVLRGALPDDVRRESHGVVAAPVLLSSRRCTMVFFFFFFFVILRCLLNETVEDSMLCSALFCFALLCSALLCSGWL